MTDDLGLRVESTASSRSRSTSPQPRQSTSDYASLSSHAMPPAPPPPPPPSSTSSSPANGINDSQFQIPRYNFPANLVASNLRKQTSIKSPVLKPEQHFSPLPLPQRSASSSRPTDSTSSNGQAHHVTETHHVTKDYDHRTGAKVINKYEFIKTVGRGVHGKVKLAKDIETGEYVAIKIVNRTQRKRLGRWDPMEAEQKVRREIAIMKKCVHPNVVALQEVMDDPNSKKIYLGTLSSLSEIHLLTDSAGVHGRRSTTVARHTNEPRLEH
jgi:hypothetical protein